MNRNEAERENPMKSTIIFALILSVATTLAAQTKVASPWQMSKYTDPVTDVTYTRFSVRSTDGTARLIAQCEDGGDASMSISTTSILEGVDSEILTRVDKEEAQSQGTDLVFLFKNAILPRLDVGDVVYSSKIQVEAEIYSEGTHVWVFNTKGFPKDALMKQCENTSPVHLEAAHDEASERLVCEKEKDHEEPETCLKEWREEQACANRAANESMAACKARLFPDGIPLCADVMSVKGSHPTCKGSLGQIFPAVLPLCKDVKPAAGGKYSAGRWV
jgi:hypothetical protein